MQTHTRRIGIGVAFILAMATALAVSLAMRAQREAAQQANLTAAVGSLRDQLHTQVTAWLADEALARDDGYVYAVDLAQLATYAAQQSDEPLYLQLRQQIVDHLLVSSSNPKSEIPKSELPPPAFIAWRYRPGPPATPLDATGTTEALRAAEALWAGDRAFDRPADRALAVRLLHGYARHAGTDQGVWLIRNYYNLGTQAFATNSYLVDYDPDFVQHVAEATGDAALHEVAQRSAALVREAVTPAGLLHQIIQPEVVTLMPRHSPIFSPNGIEQLANAATVAQRSARTCPDAARGVLGFAMDRWPELHSFYNAATGEPVGEEKFAGPETLAVLLRLAVRLEDDAACRRLLPRLLEQAQGFAHAPADPRLYTASEVLLALDEAHRFMSAAD